MRKMKLCATIAAAAFMVVGVVGWGNSNDRAFEARASTAVGTTSLDAFEMMCTAKDLPNQEFDDFSLVFTSRSHGQPSLIP